MRIKIPRQTQWEFIKSDEKNFTFEVMDVDNTTYTGETLDEPAQFTIYLYGDVGSYSPNYNFRLTRGAGDSFNNFLGDVPASNLNVSLYDTNPDRFSSKLKKPPSRCIQQRVRMPALCAPAISLYR